ncbi:MAG: GNAT family N-acetyltransferase [Pseudomonadota bacterium]
MPAQTKIEIKPADLEDPRVTHLLRSHAKRAIAETGRGSAHALDLDAFRDPDIGLWTAWEGETLLGIGAMKRLSATEGELKSFHTVEAARGRGIASKLVDHIVGVARTEGLVRLSLETGSWPYFAAARAFYASKGFVVCGPFHHYIEDENSVFMTREI